MFCWQPNILNATKIFPFHKYIGNEPSKILDIISTEIPAQVKGGVNSHFGVIFHEGGGGVGM